MKTLRIFCLLLLLFAGRAFSQPPTVDDDITLDPVVKVGISQVDGSNYEYDTYHLGTRIIENDTYISRSYFVFNLSNIPDNATITQVEVQYYTSGSVYSFKLTKPTSVSGSLQTVWNAIGSASSLHTGLSYGSSSFYSNEIKTEIQNALSSNQLIIGALSENEGTAGSHSTLDFSLYVDFSYPASALNLTARNDLYGDDGGDIGMGIYPSAATSRSSPYSFTAYETQRLSLAAYDNQTVNGKTWFFNDTEYQVEESEWKKFDGGQSSFLTNSASFTTDPLTEDDDGAAFVAFLKTTDYTTSGTMSSDEIWFTSPITLTDNVTIASGVTLTIRPNVTVQVPSGKKITVNGTLLAQGSAGNRITFKQSSGTWYGIEVNNGADFHPMFCDFENVQTAIRYYNASGDVNNCTFTNYATALRYENSSSGRIEYSSMIDYGGTGIDAVQYAYPDARSYNAIEDNYYGVKGDNTSAPVLGYSAGGGYNSVVNAVWDVYSTNATTLYAVYNWWGSSSPSPNLYGDIVWQPYLSTNPLAKSSGQREPRVVLPTFAPEDTIGVSAFNQALRLYFAEDYATVLPLLQDLVSTYADYTIGRQAPALESCVLAKLSRSTEALSRLHSVKQSNAGKEIAGLAHSLLVGLYIRNGDYAGAKVAAVEILQNHAGSDLEKYALYDLGLIHWYHFDDPKTGDSYFRQLIAAYPDDALAASARATLGEWQPPPADELAEGDTRKPAADANDTVPATFTLFANHPNPFNPITVIRYGLPASGEVTLRVFDSLGREVRVWHLGVQAAGLHTVRWDGRDAAGEAVASGVYFYRLAFHPLAADNTPRLQQGKMSLLR